MRPCILLLSGTLVTAIPTLDMVLSSSSHQLTALNLATVAPAYEDVLQTDDLIDQVEAFI
jgi:hypothetical protein